ncbi:hypothetical protein KAX06_03945 [candidate division WOR-3 bacterium]|nr:hypothetical protein [candidate division WOR-3 bacterium]
MEQLPAKTQGRWQWLAGGLEKLRKSGNLWGGLGIAATFVFGIVFTVIGIMITISTSQSATSTARSAVADSVSASIAEARYNEEPAPTSYSLIQSDTVRAEETPDLDTLVMAAIAQNPSPPNVIPTREEIKAMYSAYYARRNARNNSILDETRQQVPDSTFRKFKQAYDLYRVTPKTRSNLETARDILIELMDQGHEFYRLFYSLGLTYAYLGDHDSALEYYLKAEPYEDSLKTHDPSLYNSIGWEYLARNEADSAFKYFADALDLDNQHPLAWAGLLKIQKRDPKKYVYPRHN